MKKLLTFADLYKYFEEQGKDCVFSSAKTNTQFLIGEEGVMTFAEDRDSDLLAVHLQACHTGKNDNKCFVSNETMTAALPSLINKPILGFIYKDDEGEFQFREHDRHKEDGEIVYDEQMVGFLPESCNPKIVYDEVKKKDYVEVDGYIVENYTKAADILRREQECAVSVEMAVNEMQYDAKEKILNITDFIFTGVTILGRFEDGTKVKEGMAGSNIKIKNAEVSFAEQQAKLEEMAKQIAEIQQSLAIDNSEKGGEQGLMKFDELLAKYNKTAEDITFETEGLSDEELEKAFAKAFAVEEEPAEEGEGEGEVDEPAADSEPKEEGEPVVEDPTAEVPEDDKDAAPSASEDNGDAGVITASLKVGEKEFSLNIDEKYTAISNLVNMTYGGEDDWFGVTFYDEDGYVIMQSWCTGDAYRQNVERNGDTYALVGERVAVQSVWVTEDEKTQLDSMRNSYNDIQSRLQHYEDESSKMDVLNGEEYAGVRDSEEFEKLMEIDAHFELSVDEVKSQADSILLNAAKTNSLKFADQNVQTTRKAFQLKSNKSSGRYGNMFNK